MLCVVDVAMLCRSGAVAAIHDVAARQQVASGVDVMEGPPAVKVDVDLRSAIHVNVQVARLIDQQVVECGVGGGAETVGGLSWSAATFVGF